MVDDPELEVRDRVKTAIQNFHAVSSSSGSGMNSSASGNGGGSAAGGGDGSAQRC